MKKYSFTMNNGGKQNFDDYHQYIKALENYLRVDSLRGKDRHITEEMKETEAIPEEQLQLELDIENETDKEEK